MNWNTVNFNDKTIKSMEYTKRAVINMNKVIESKDFDDMDSDHIFSYLADTMMIFSFSDYLKRYLYVYAEIKEPFHTIDDKTFIDIVKFAFDENHAPHDFGENSLKWSQKVKRFFTSNSAKRSTIFLLGFGLSMSDADVSDFLTKVILEEDFDMTNPTELIYWYCFRYQVHYAKAVKLLTFYDKLTKDEIEDKVITDPKSYIRDERTLKEYLCHLKFHSSFKEKQDLIFDEYMRLYERAKISVLHIMETYEDNAITLDKIRPSNIEAILCCGVPMNEKGSLEKMSRSKLSAQFKNKRMNRQRLSGILSRKLTIERFDFITLLFLIYAIDVEPDWPTERYFQYIDEINQILTRCNMMEIYPVNPYEAFILMCLISDSPLSVYNEVFELSYMDEENSL